MFSAPTAIRVLRSRTRQLHSKYDLSKLRALYCAGEADGRDLPLVDDGRALGSQVIDHYWQTEPAGRLALS